MATLPTAPPNSAVPPPPGAPPLPLSYAIPDPPSCFLTLYLSQLALTLPLGVLTIFLFVIVVPPFRERFADFRIKLPFLTECVIHLSEWIIHGLGWFPLLIVAIAAPLPLAFLFRHLTDPRARIRAIVRSLSLLLFTYLLFGVLFAMGLFAPLLYLVHSVSGDERSGAP